MKPELWLNRADHELTLAQELFDAGSLLWAVSYAHRSVEYALEGLIVMKTGTRPEKGSRMADLQYAARNYLTDEMNSAVTDLEKISPLVWQSDLKAEQIVLLTNKRAQELIDGGKKILSWIGGEWEKMQDPPV